MIRRRVRGGSAKEHATTPWDLLVVGLGNPGVKYRGTVHNVGVEVVELLAGRFDGRFTNSKHHASVAELRIGERKVVLATPQVFMNESGQAVAPLVRHYGISDLARLVVVHDELDLEPGRMKVKLGGGLAGHNGLRSIRDHLHTTEFGRIRLGVGKPPGGAAGGVKHVLSAPSKQHRALIDVTVVEAADATEMILHEGIEAAMGRYNQRS